MRRRIWLTVLVVIVVAAATGGYLYYRDSAAAAAAADEPPLQTAVARQGEIVVSATGAGAIIAAEEIELSFSGSGVLVEVLVEIGQKVTAGDVLARIDDQAAQQSLANAQLQLGQAAMQTDASASQTGVSFDDISVETARLTLETAQQELDELLDWQPDEAEVALLEAKVVAAESAYNAARGQEAASSTNINLKQISLEQAQRNLADAEASYTTAFDPARDWELNDPMRAPRLEAERAAAERNLQQAQESLEVAQLNFDAAVSSTNSSSSANAESNLLSARQTLEAARLGPTSEQITAARTAVRKAELALQQALLNQESHALSLEQSRLNVEAAEQAVANTVLIAPMDGTVMAVNGHVGEQIGSSAFISLANLAQPMLEIFLDETDLDKAGVGYEVEVVLDALPDEVFTGRVVQVDPQLYQSSGVSAIRATVLLDYSKPQSLPIGLNATVEVIGGRAENAVLVPVEALREISAGQYAVFVMVNDEPTLRMVEVGLMDFSFAEIVSGLEAGEVVSTGIVQTQQESEQ